MHHHFGLNFTLIFLESTCICAVLNFLRSCNFVFIFFVFLFLFYLFVQSCITTKKQQFFFIVPKRRNNKNTPKHTERQSANARTQNANHKFNSKARARKKKIGVCLFCVRRRRQGVSWQGCRAALQNTQISSFFVFFG